MKEIYKIRVIQGDGESLHYNDYEKNITIIYENKNNFEIVGMNSVELIKLLDESNINEINPRWKWKFNSDISAALIFSVFGFLVSLVFNHLRSSTKYVGIKLKDGRSFLCVMSENIYNKMKYAQKN